MFMGKGISWKYLVFKFYNPDSYRDLSAFPTLYYITLA
jgi:hypothetical protein